MLELNNFSVKIHKKEIVHPMNLTMQMGIHALLGPNGAGKTTWMRGVLQLYPGNKKTYGFRGNRSNRDRWGICHSSMAFFRR